MVVGAPAKDVDMPEAGVMVRTKLAIILLWREGWAGVYLKPILLLSIIQQPCGEWQGVTSQEQNTQIPETCQYLFSTDQNQTHCYVRKQHSNQP